MTSPRIPPVPAVLRLVQEVVLGRWRATGEDLYREVARLVEAHPGQEIVVSGCGEGETTQWVASHTRAAVTGVDASHEAIERAEARLREMPEPLPLSYQTAALDDLPHENGVFDVAIGEPVLAAANDPDRAVAELARVTKPMGVVVLMQLTWSSELSSEARELLVERLGMRPHLLVEWKQMLRDAGVVDIQVQDWTTGAPSTATRTSGRTSGRITGSFEAVTPQLGWQDKMRIAARAWSDWGMRAGALRAGRGAIEREETLLRELSKERAIGFQVIKGVKWPHAKSE